uniref:SAC3_GANP domain-containing protein n=1 Tax=Heterorhabditis bacteriophora TaxID=37862 RepID=A0A1I7WWP3_HETBA
MNIIPSSKDCVVGTCLLMCPPSEVRFRNENHLIHQLESSQSINSSSGRLIGDPQKMVKEYIRSAAGCSLLNPEILRPPTVLLTTIDYLLDLYRQMKLSQLTTVFSFVSDRLRAVRQDMILQQPSPVDTMKILQKMIPFYIETDYFCKLHECSAYDYKLHSTQIEECFSRWNEVVRQVPKDLVNPLIVCSYLMRRISEPSSMLEVYRWKSYLSVDLWTIVHSIVLCARSCNYSGFFRNLRRLPSGFTRASTVNAIICIRLRTLTLIGNYDFQFLFLNLLD